MAVEGNGGKVARPTTGVGVAQALSDRRPTPGQEARFVTWPTLRGPGHAVTPELTGGRHLPNQTDRMTGARNARDRRDAQLFGQNGTADSGV